MKPLSLVKVVVILMCTMILSVMAVYLYPFSDTQSTQDLQKLNEIRSRENIKLQQELIVQETYLGEEKARIQNEKGLAIQKFDSQINDIEKQLETVRSKKMSFQ